MEDWKPAIYKQKQKFFFLYEHIYKQLQHKKLNPRPIGLNHH